MNLQCLSVRRREQSLPNEMTMCRICASNVSCGSDDIVSDLNYIQYMAPLVGSLHVVASSDAKRTFGEYAYQNNKKNIMATVGSNNTKSDR